jgi:hypothetical protein
MRQSKDNAMSKPISERRKAAYYVGSGLMAAGGLLFASVFVSEILHFGDFNNFAGTTKSTMFRAVGGIALLVIGRFLRMTAAMGLAGSGLILDPTKARKDVEPYSRMAGGVAKDLLEAAEINPGNKQEKVVMIKCQNCGKLNEEDSKFCQECGKPL